MSTIEPIGYDDLNTTADLATYFSRTYKAIDEAENRTQLDAIYEDVIGLVKFTYSLRWREKFGDVDADDYQKFVVTKYQKVSQMLNRRARELGSEPDFSEEWQAELGVHGSRIDRIVRE